MVCLFMENIDNYMVYLIIDSKNLETYTKLQIKQTKRFKLCSSILKVNKSYYVGI